MNRPGIGGEAAAARSRGRQPTELDAKEYVSREAATADTIAVVASRLGHLLFSYCGLTPTATCCRRCATHDAAFTRWRIVLVWRTCALFCSRGSAESDKSSIVLFLVDDMGVMDTSVPNLAKDNERYALHVLACDRSESNNLAAEQPKKLPSMMQSMVRKLDTRNAVYPMDDGRKLKPAIPETTKR